MTDEFKRGMLRAAELAELYADENMRMTHDTILADPILNEAKRKLIRNPVELADASRVSERLTLESHGYSSRYHAGTDIAAMIRKDAEDSYSGSNEGNRCLKKSQET